MKRFFKKITGLLALALVLTAVAGGIAKTSAEEEDESALSGGTYRDAHYQFAVDFPQGWVIQNTGHEEEQPIIGFIDLKGNGLSFLPRGEIQTLFPLQPTRTTEVLIDGRQAIRKEWDIENGEMRIKINVKGNYPPSWNEENLIYISVNNKEQLSLLDQMLESIQIW